MHYFAHAYYQSVRQRIRYFRIRLRLLAIYVFLIWYADCLPETLFQESHSTVLLSSGGELLGAHISKDEQWRFPECDSVPLKFKTCLIAFEDRNFYHHPGVSIKGLFRAFIQNIGRGERVSGGSTLTMQLVRLMRKNPPRTYREKLHEIILATRVEIRLEKEEILRLYSSYAPFGNNVVGLEAASWRFYGRPPHLLSWAESATLAVLPNAPGLIYPGKNHDRLLAKRNRLLRYLYEHGTLDKTSYETALTEPLPDSPLPLPSLSPHLLMRAMQEGKTGTTIHSTIRESVQIQSGQILERHLALLRENKIYNGSVLITSVHSGEIIAYTANTSYSDAEHAPYVDCIQAARSTGSVIKPLLYAKSMQAGLISPEMLLTDLPSRYGGFSPTNYTNAYDGLVPANEALSRSLNIPFVQLLNTYGLSRFHGDLRQFGFSSITHNASHYGLSLILGGAEVRSDELNEVYGNLARQLLGEPQRSLSYVSGNHNTLTERVETDRACIYETFRAMLAVTRPDEENNWQYFSSGQKIAWKTGTSFGFRDAWAVGITPDYVVTVWIGNADGEGRPGLTGINAAAPVLFDVFKTLDRSKNWFPKPEDRFEEVRICTTSGHRATADCPHTVLKAIPVTTLRSAGCPYHRIIHLDPSEKNRVTSACIPVHDMHHRAWFMLPPFIEKFYRKSHPSYQPPPPFLPGCADEGQRLYVIYPHPDQKIYLPTDMQGMVRPVIFEATRNGSGTIYWHLDDQFIGQTSDIHQLALRPETGKHLLTVVDESGIQSTVAFEITEK